MRSVHSVRTMLATLGVLVGGLAFASAPALAAEQWDVVSTFGGSTSTPADPQPLSGPDWVAINQSTNDVYVVDAKNNRVEYFSSTGSYIGQFNGTEIDGAPAGAGKEAPTGSFSSPGQIAVDNDPSSPSFEDVYVADVGHNVVDKFTATGAYIGQLTGWCTKTGEALPCSGSEFKPFSELEGVAVDSEGKLWVYQAGPEPDGYITDFSSALANKFISSRTVQIYYFVPGLAVDSEDNLYIGSPYSGLWKFNSAGQELDRDTGGFLGRPTGWAVVEPSNSVFIDTGSLIGVAGAEAPHPTTAGTPFVETFGEGPLSDGAGVAVDSASGDVYVTEPVANEVYIFQHSSTPQTPPPAPSTGSATEVTPTSWQLHGTLKPAAGETKLGYYFEYNSGTSCTGTGSHKTPLLIEQGTGEVSVSTEVTRLKPHEGYAFCLVADKFGATAGPQQTFSTGGAPPEVISESASNLEQKEGEFTAIINPEVEETTYYFEYATTEAAIGTSEAKKGGDEEPLTAEPEEQTAHRGARLGEVAATYYYRVIATNGTGETKGKIQAYTKLPILSGQSVSGLTLTSATLHAEVDPAFQQTKYGFEYATDKETLEKGQGTRLSGAEELEANEEPLPSARCKDGTVPTLEGGSFACDDHSEPKCANGATPTPRENRLVCLDPVDITIEGLESYQRYYYRAVAENESTENPGNADKGVPVVGEVKEFTTRSLPITTTGAAQGITSTTAALSGTVTPPFVTATYYFEYINQQAYEKALAGDAQEKANPYTEGDTTPPVNLTPGETPQAVEIEAGSLLPETTYVYRIVAINQFGDSISAASSFATTAGPPSPTPPSEAGGGLPGSGSQIAVPASPPLLVSPNIAFPKEEKGSGTTVKTLTSKEKLAKALKQCKRDKSKSKRQACEKAAKKRYPVGKAKKKAGKKK
jgi:hypothetical protein